MKNMLKPYKVYLKIGDGSYMGMELLIMANDIEEAKLGAQKVMRKRFGQELGRDYTISKTLKIKKK